MYGPPVPLRHSPPVGPVSRSVYGWPCRAAHSATTSATSTPSCSGVSTWSRAGRADYVDPVHPRVAGEDHVDQVAECPGFLVRRRRPAERATVAGG